MKQPHLTLELEFASLEFYDCYVISRLKEDVIFDYLQLEELVQLSHKHYGTQQFVYISHRLENYNVNPTAYLKLSAVKNLCGIAIVSQKTSALKMAAFEKNFAKVPFEVFLEIERAKEWAIKKVKK
jgi:hypothetical protein